MNSTISHALITIGIPLAQAATYKTTSRLALNASMDNVTVMQTSALHAYYTNNNIAHAS